MPGGSAGARCEDATASGPLSTSELNAGALGGAGALDGTPLDAGDPRLRFLADMELCQEMDTHERQAKTFEVVSADSSN